MGIVKDLGIIPKRVYRDQLVTITDLKEFKQDLLFSLSQLIAGNAAKPPKKWLKSKEVKNLLNISYGTLQALRANGTIPFTKIGHTIFYDQEEINEVLTNKQRQYHKGVLPPKKK